MDLYPDDLRERGTIREVLRDGFDNEIALDRRRGSFVDFYLAGFDIDMKAMRLQSGRRFLRPLNSGLNSRLTS